MFSNFLQHPTRRSFALSFLGLVFTVGTLACASASRRSAVATLPIVELQTDSGSIYLEIDSIRAPKTAENFLRYVDRGLLNGAEFGRTVSPSNEKVFQLDLLQADRPRNATPPDDPPVPLEPTSETGILHVLGTVSMARGQPTTTATSSFFICLEAEPSLDFGGKASGDGQGYGAFGRVVKGLELVKKIHAGPAEGQRLKVPVVIVSARRVKM